MMLCCESLFFDLYGISQTGLQPKGKSWDGGVCGGGNAASTFYLAPKPMTPSTRIRGGASGGNRSKTRPDRTPN
jgi:hypothetical protein